MAAPVLLGYLLVGCVWPARARSRSEILVKLAIGAGLGLALASLLVFLGLLLAGSLRGDVVLSMEAVLVAGLGLGALARRGAAGHDRAGVVAGSDRAPARVRLVAAGLVLAVCAGTVLFVASTLKHLHGGYDASAIWNLRARFLFLGGAHWQDAFSPYLFWSHPDYPLLLPAAVARGWLHLGTVDILAPIGLAVVFWAATVAALVSAVTLLRGREQGCLAGALLLAAPLFTMYGTSQAADVPVTFFYLATCVLLALRGAWTGGGRPLTMLAGMAAACAAWTKNEGLLFLVAIVAGLALAGGLSAGPVRALRDLGDFGLGALPFLAAIAYFKTALAPGSDLLEGQALDATLGRLGDVSRHLAVLRGFAANGVRLGGSPIPVLILPLVYLLACGVSVQARHRPHLQAIVIGLLAMGAGLYLVYVTTPHDLRWHMRYSLDRVLLQLWPSAIFAYALVVRPPGGAGGEPDPGSCPA